MKVSTSFLTDLRELVLIALSGFTFELVPSLSVSVSLELSKLAALIFLSYGFYFFIGSFIAYLLATGAF